VQDSHELSSVGRNIVVGVRLLRRRSNLVFSTFNHCLIYANYLLKLTDLPPPKQICTYRNRQIHRSKTDLQTHLVGSQYPAKAKSWHVSSSVVKEWSPMIKGKQSPVIVRKRSTVRLVERRR